jgi:copper chaperone CopZ
MAIAFITPLHVMAGNHDVVTAKFTVNGVCEKCKKRIEEAAYIKGVKYADWDVYSHQLIVKYDSSKTTSDIILQSIAKSGHDAGNFKALHADYEKLPSCCRYREGVKMH